MTIEFSREWIPERLVDFAGLDFEQKASPQRRKGAKIAKDGTGQQIFATRAFFCVACVL